MVHIINIVPSDRNVWPGEGGAERRGQIQDGAGGGGVATGASPCSGLPPPASPSTSTSISGHHGVSGGPGGNGSAATGIVFPSSHPLARKHLSPMLVRNSPGTSSPKVYMSRLGSFHPLQELFFHSKVSGDSAAQPAFTTEVEVTIDDLLENRLEDLFY